MSALEDLDRSVPLPRTPWSPPETVYWPVRRVLLHLIRRLSTPGTWTSSGKHWTGPAPPLNGDRTGGLCPDCEHTRREAERERQAAEEAARNNGILARIRARAVDR